MTSSANKAATLPPQNFDPKKHRKNNDKLEEYFLTVAIFVLLVIFILIVTNTNRNNRSNNSVIEICRLPDFPSVEELLKINHQIQAAKYSNASLKMPPKDYNLAQIRCGALAHIKEGDRTTISGKKFETAVRIVFESIKIHTYHDGREWIDMCKRITQEMYKEFRGNWHCIVSDKLINSFVRPDGNYMNIKLEDLFFEIFRS